MKRKAPTSLFLLDPVGAGPASRRTVARAPVVRKMRQRRRGAGRVKAAYALHVVGSGRDSLRQALTQALARRAMVLPQDDKAVEQPSTPSGEGGEAAEIRAAHSMKNLRDTLLSVVSHELRSPLSGIESWTHVLKHSLQGGDGMSVMPPQAGRALAGISAGVRRQVAAVDSLIDSARVLSGDAGLHYAVFRLGDAVEQALREAADDIGAKRLTVMREVLVPAVPAVSAWLAREGGATAVPRPVAVSAATSIAVTSFAAADTLVSTQAYGPSDALPLDWQTVMGDFERVKQVVAQLLSNAIKFNRTGGTIRLKIDAVSATLRNVEQDGGTSSPDSRVRGAMEVPWVRLAVEDTGVGIAPDVLSDIFLRFQKPDQAYTRRNDGFGLGLAVARELVTLHGGQLHAASAGESQGACFTMVLPGPRDMGRGAALRGVNGLDEQGFLSLAGLSIMIVDDQLEARESLSAVFEQSGAQVMPAASARDALAQLEARGPRREPDVLICDIAMPDEDGYTTLRRIRQWEHDHGVLPKERMAAIAVTAFAEHEDRERALSRGYALHFAKPVDPDRLLDAVAALSAGRESDETTSRKK